MVRFSQISAAIAAVALLSACSQEPQQPAGPTGDLRTDIVPTLLADENTNLTAALQQAPASAQMVHIIADGHIVALHYIDGANAVADFTQFDDAHAVTAHNHLETPARWAAPEPVAPPNTTNEEAEQANERTIVAFYQAASASPQQAAETYLADDFVDHALNGGRDAWLSQMTGNHFDFGVQQVASWNDMVAVYVTVGVTANGAHSWLPGYDFFRLRDGKIVEEWRFNY